MKQIFQHTGTDKLTRHAYHRYYDIWFERFYSKTAVRMLEIGADGGRSLSAWSMFFKKQPVVHGLSYGVKVDYKSVAKKIDAKSSENIKIFYGDQSSPETLTKLIRDGALTEGKDLRLDASGWDHYGYDIIIDDGSHVPTHIIASFKSLFPSVRPGGLYVVEDLECGYWDNAGAQIYGYPLPGGGIGKIGIGNAAEKFKQLIDVLQRFHVGVNDLTVFGPEVDHMIHSIEFGENLVLITKKTPEQARDHPNVGSAPVNKVNIKNWQKSAQATNIRR